MDWGQYLWGGSRFIQENQRVSTTYQSINLSALGKFIPVYWKGGSQMSES